MPRYFLELSYNGTAYHGWQIQKNAVSVQSVLQDAISKFNRQPVEVTGAGRTDTGVHALQFYCHFDLNKRVKDHNDFVFHLNAMLPHDIVAHNLLEVLPEAHARFDAVSRTYVYGLHTEKSAFAAGMSWFYPHPLDIDKMNKACEVLKKFNDFSCFSKSRTQVKTNLCTIKKAVWKHIGAEIKFEITANRFLRNMVRAIVGTVIEVGRGEITLKQFEEIIRSGDRSKAGLSVPACGLYLSAVKYPDKIFI